jgi:hypothetical protein
MPLRRIIVVSIALLLSALPVYAVNPELQVVDKDCWVEIFEDNGFDMDDPHVKLMGPQVYATMKNLMGRDWDDDIESLVVGPSAHIKAYSKKDFAGTEIAFTPNQRVPELSKLNMANEIESIKITCGRH